MSKKKTSQNKCSKTAIKLNCENKKGSVKKCIKEKSNTCNKSNLNYRSNFQKQTVNIRLGKQTQQRANNKGKNTKNVTGGLGGGGGGGVASLPYVPPKSASQNIVGGTRKNDLPLEEKIDDLSRIVKDLSQSNRVLSKNIKDEKIADDKFQESVASMITEPNRQTQMTRGELLDSTKPINEGKLSIHSKPAYPNLTLTQPFFPTTSNVVTKSKKKDDPYTVRINPNPINQLNANRKSFYNPSLSTMSVRELDNSIYRPNSKFNPISTIYANSLSIQSPNYLSNIDGNFHIVKLINSNYENSLKNKVGDKILGTTRAITDDGNEVEIESYSLSTPGWDTEATTTNGKKVFLESVSLKDINGGDFTDQYGQSASSFVDELEMKVDKN